MDRQIQNAHGSFEAFLHTWQVPAIDPTDNSTIRNVQATITTIAAPWTDIQMLHREIPNLWLGALVLSAMVSASVSAAGEWIPYNGTFPGMVGSICSEAHPAHYVAVRSRDEWVAYWEPLRPRIWQTPTTTTAPTVPQPEVDFSKYIVLIASSGCKPSGGYGLQLDSIQEDKSGLIVNIIETERGRGCGVAPVVTNPTIHVLIPQTARKIKFNTSKVIHNCV